MVSFPFNESSEPLGKAITALGTIWPTLHPDKPFPFGKLKAQEDPSSSSSGSGSPWTAPGAGPQFQWSFPQYSQTWAFTPPAPSAFNLPPRFDPKSKTGYYTPPAPKTASSKTSLAALMAKYK